MHLEQSEWETSEGFTTFSFYSEGPKGRIPKLVQFSLIYTNNSYNISFGDLDTAIGEIDDLIVTDNGDSLKVLATVVTTVYSFSNYSQTHGCMQKIVQRPEPGCIGWE